jgi:hypothetical protein
MTLDKAARIGDHIEYYYVDSEPIPKLALESGQRPPYRLCGAHNTHPEGAE